ncbi:hypothetical protein C8F04DRAFT_1180944 [Mycena alexandri]|uniref:Uncharacterized protein n=1 Tax=Mycena alexandri TaxID=1745969 RepID=A0AAD6X521_9AGAR|nr:hypothetical protein C8F04DRAFT_1180944 [Mycena alexandri]
MRLGVGADTMRLEVNTDIVHLEVDADAAHLYVVDGRGGGKREEGRREGEHKPIGLCLAHPLATGCEAGEPGLAHCRLGRRSPKKPWEKTRGRVRRDTRLSMKVWSPSATTKPDSLEACGEAGGARKRWASAGVIAITGPHTSCEIWTSPLLMEALQILKVNFKKSRLSFMIPHDVIRTAVPSRWYITKTGNIWDAQIRQVRPGGVAINLDFGIWPAVVLYS